MVEIKKDNEVSFYVFVTTAGDTSVRIKIIFFDRHDEKSKIKGEFICQNYKSVCKYT